MERPSLCALIILFATTILITIVDCEVVKNGCNRAVSLNKKKKTDKWDAKLPIHKAKHCTYTVAGDEDCNVEVSCKVDIPESDDCDDGFVKITDGVDGEKLLCGKTENRFIAGEGLRDLFVRLESTAKSGHVSCTSKCVSGSGADKKLRLKKNKKKKIDNRCACGFQNKDDRIVGGEDAKMNEFPWLAAIVFAGTRSPTCGASVINDRYILTAAHCFWFDNKQPNEIEVLIHAHTLDMTKKSDARDVELGEDGSIRSAGYNAESKTDEDENTQRFQVAEIINHPLFNEFYDYDVALLRLTKKIDLAAADAPTPICLPPANTWDSMMGGWNGKEFLVAGWGMAAENAGGSTRLLQKLHVPYLHWKSCTKKVPPGVLTRRMICAGFDKGGRDACTGDSGGPLVSKMPTKQFWQVGVVSWGEGCARAGRPGIYSRVTEFMQWINFHSSEGESKWCEGPKKV